MNRPQRRGFECSRLATIAGATRARPVQRGLIASLSIKLVRTRKVLAPLRECALCRSIKYNFASSSVPQLARQVLTRKSLGAAWPLESEGEKLIQFFREVNLGDSHKLLRSRWCALPPTVVCRQRVAPSTMAALEGRRDFNCPV